MTKTYFQIAQSARIEKWSRGAVYALLGLMILTLGRVVQLKLAPDPKMATALRPPMSTRVEMANRGEILDRKGRSLAVNRLGHRLFIDPVSVADIADAARKVGEAIGRDGEELDRLIRSKPGSRYVVIDHELDDWQAEAVRNLGLHGVAVEPRLLRDYPQGLTAAPLIGLVGFEGKGLGGVERKLNGVLAPENGRMTYLRDAQNRLLWIDPSGYEPREDGEPVRLTIDLVIQQMVEDRLGAAVKEFNAGGGRAIVLDCQTGQILAMTDVLQWRKGWKEVTDDPLRRTHPALGRNRCLTDPYEPGSTFKPFVWGAATELGKARLEETIACSDGSGYRVGKRVIRDAHYYGPVSWKTVLVKSINSGMAIVAQRMSREELQTAVRKFGFGQATDIGLPGETIGKVTRAKDWSDYTQCSVAMGHEISVTPVQMVRAFAAFCRDGTIPNLRLLLPSNAEEALATEQEDASVREAITSKTVMQARDAMRGVMTEGTGKKAESELYQIFGKSGTAQLPKPKSMGKGYFEDRYVASFIGGAPFDQPRVVVLVVIDDPDRAKGHFGGSIAGPVVKDIVDATLMYLGVAPDQPGAAEKLHEREKTRNVAAR
jgi:cell division protein FtsI (penicillin-binding protein 3)